MLSKDLENSLSYDILYKFWKQARVYYILSISKGGGQAPGPPLDSPLPDESIKFAHSRLYVILSICFSGYMPADTMEVLYIQY